MKQVYAYHVRLAYKKSTKKPPDPGQDSRDLSVGEVAKPPDLPQNISDWSVDDFCQFALKYAHVEEENVQKMRDDGIDGETAAELDADSL